jgi:hypothetical protein
MKTKQIALTLMFFVSFALFFAGCKTLKVEGTFEVVEKKTVEKIDNTPKQNSQVQQSAPVDSRAIPLTWAIVKNIKNSGLKLNDLDYYLSKSFAMTIIERNDKQKKLEIIDRVLKAPKEPSIKTARIEFTSDQKGVMSEDYPESPETFVVNFLVEEKKYSLTFKRNLQGRYDLIFAVIDGERHSVPPIEGPPPQLCILAELNEHVEMLAIFDSKHNDIRSWPSSEAPSFKAINIGGLPSRQFDSIRIDGTEPRVNKTGIINYVRQNRSVDSATLATLSSLIDMYFDEAKREGINPSIAIAQMLYHTNFLRKNMTTRNYAELNTVNARLNGKPWNGKFDSMRIGVRAHIQHLKGYVSRERPKNPIVDPRYALLGNIRGNVKTLELLFETWVPRNSAAYGNSISNILTGIQSYSGN